MCVNALMLAECRALNVVDVWTGFDVAVRPGVQRRLGQHHVHGSWRCRSRPAGRAVFSVVSVIRRSRSLLQPIPTHFSVAWSVICLSSVTFVHPSTDLDAICQIASCCCHLADRNEKRFRVSSNNFGPCYYNYNYVQQAQLRWQVLRTTWTCGYVGWR